MMITTASSTSVDPLRDTAVNDRDMLFLPFRAPWAIRIRENLVRSFVSDRA